MSYCFNSTNSSIGQHILSLCVHVHFDLKKLLLFVVIVIVYAYESSICTLTKQLCAKKEANGSGSADNKGNDSKVANTPVLIFYSSFLYVHIMLFSFRAI